MQHFPGSTRFQGYFLGGTVAAALFALVPVTAAEAAVIVFGDSTSDTGATAAATGGLIPPPILPSQTSPTGFVEAYFNGRFTNGPNWLDFLIDDLGIPESDVSNFAVSGATTGTQNTTGIPTLTDLGLQTQVDSFLQSSPMINSDDLVVVWAGNNDYLRTANQTDPSIPVANIELAIRKLADGGAKKFLVANVPDLGLTPIISGDPDASDISDRTQQHKNLLDATIQALQADDSLGLTLASLDIFSLINDAVANPTASGFTNVEDACLFPSPLFFPPAPGDSLTPVTKCADPDQYLWWDSLHPSSQAYRLTADAALKALADASAPTTSPTPSSQSVPEPASALALGILTTGLLIFRKVMNKMPGVG